MAATDHQQGRAPAAPPAAGATPSPLQQRVLDFVRGGAGHGVVEATAGSGKTTTLVQVANLLPAAGAACFLAFNRATAAELRDRLPAHVEATTIHALGRATLLAGLPELAAATPTGAKYRTLALELVRERTPDLGSPAELAEYLARLADLCRLALAPAAHEPAVAEVAARHRLESPVPGARTRELWALLPALLERGAATARAGLIDFTDMLHLPLVLGLAPPRFDFVCVDEAQDLSPLTLAFVMRLIEDGARALFVGDPKQAIYAFAGAGSNSLARITAETGATVLPLSVSFRCPTRHVTLARRFSPAMQAAPGASAGSVRLVAAPSLPRLARPGDLIMSRVNAPLVGLCLRLTGVGTPARVLGADLAEPVLALARHLFGGTLPPHAAAVVARHAAAEAERLERALLTSPALAEVLRVSSERHRALALLLRRLPRARRHDLGELERLTRQLLVSAPGGADAAPGAGPSAADVAASAAGAPHVVLSTIHKAKGREAQRVFLLYPEELAPAPPADVTGASGGPPDGALAASVDDEAEGNVIFVALTRAKAELVLVERSPGALRARLAAHRAQQGRRLEGGREGDGAAVLARHWSEALSLAALMARAKGGGGGRPAGPRARRAGSPP